MQIKQGSERFEELFGRLGADGFRSSLPPYEVIQDALLDASLDPAAVSEVFGVQDRVGPRGVLQRQGVADLQNGVRFMLKHMSTRVDLAASLARTSAGVLTRFAPALGDITSVLNLGTTLDVAGVDRALGLAPVTGPDGTAVKVAFGIGMTALSAMGPVGAAAATIVGIVGAIFGAVRSKKRQAGKDREARRRAAYEQLPPLQEPRDIVDEWYVRNTVMAAMETGTWTPLFRPRFDPRKGWQGQPRFGGFAFAPGDTIGEPDEFGNDNVVFKNNGGAGFIPGLNQVTSVIQVGLDALGPEVETWYHPKSGRRFPIKQIHVKDVGSFYVNTTRLCAVAWAWVTQQEGSPDLYKVFVGTADHPHEDSLHYQWREYCDGGLRYLHEIRRGWYGKNGQNLLENPDDRSWLYGMAISCAIGAWRCFEWEGEVRQSNLSRVRFEMSSARDLGREYGCVGIPPMLGRVAEGKDCLTTMYHVRIRDTLIAVRRRQEHFLRRSLVCAYVRRGWDAFKDPGLADLLGKMRTALLEHPDRKLVELDDVPREETHNGRNWYEQLVEAGAGKSKASKWMVGNVGTIDPGDDPAPRVPGDDAPMPFSGLRGEREPGQGTLVFPGSSARGSAWKKVAAGAGIAALIGAGAYGYYRYQGREDHG